jgi:hypothetical protein
MIGGSAFFTLLPFALRKASRRRSRLWSHSSMIFDFFSLCEGQR